MDFFRQCPSRCAKRSMIGSASCLDLFEPLDQCCKRAKCFVGRILTRQPLPCLMGIQGVAPYQRSSASLRSKTSRFSAKMSNCMANGLIIRLRKDTVGSTPTRPTSKIKELRAPRLPSIFAFAGRVTGA